MLEGTQSTAVRGYLKVIGRVTGVEPETCPWRAFYHPLVKEVRALSPILGTHAAAAALPANTPAILIDAIAHYHDAIAATQNEEAKLRLAEAKRAREAQQ